MDSTTDIIIKKRYKPLCGREKNGGGGGKWGDVAKLEAKEKFFPGGKTQMSLSVWLFYLTLYQI